MNVLKHYRKKSTKMQLMIISKNYNEDASTKGENRAIIPLSKGVILKDGTRLTEEEVREHAKKDGSYIYDAYESDTDRFLRQFFDEIINNK